MRARASRARSMRHKRLIYLTHPRGGVAHHRPNEGKTSNDVIDGPSLSAASSQRTRNLPPPQGTIVFLNYIKTE